MAEPQEDFSGNDKHYKMLRKALQEKDISIWNDFAAAMGPRFRADLRGIDLSGQDLTGARLASARLDKACLDGANLTGVDLTDAVLTGASLREAVLSGTKLKVPGRVRVQKQAAPEDPSAELDPEARRRRKLDAQSHQAFALLEDRKKKEEALERQKAQVKAKNNPSPFANNSK